MTNAYSKNKTMRTGILLTLIALITIFCMCSTFAKYVTSGQFNDEARVAKWGIDVPGSKDINLWKSEYKSEALDPSVTVRSENGDNVIAPGTTNSATFTIANVTGRAPEVMYDFNVKIDFRDPNHIMDKLDKYPREKWWWEITTPNGAKSGKLSTSDFKDYIDCLTQKNVAPNTLPAWFGAPGKGTYQLKLEWGWAFDNFDKEDTSLGNMEAFDPSSTEFGMTITVEAVQCLGCVPTVDPQIVVPTDTVNVIKGQSKNVNLSQAGVAFNWYASSSDEDVATVAYVSAENTKNKTIAITGVAEGDATITVGVPEAGEYKAEEKTFNVHVVDIAKEKEDASKAVDASADEMSNLIEEYYNDGELFEDYKDQVVDSLQQAIDIASNKIKAATTVEEITTAKTEFFAKIVIMETATETFREDTLKSKNDSIEDASSDASAMIKSISDNSSLYTKNKENCINAAKGQLNNVSDSIKEAKTKQGVQTAMNTFHDAMDVLSYLVDEFSVADQSSKTKCINDCNSKKEEVDASIEVIDNLTPETKTNVYEHKVWEFCTTARDKIATAYNEDAAKEEVDKFREASDKVLDDAIKQATREWETNWDPSTEVEVDASAKVSLDASAYVLPSDPYYAQAPDASYSLNEEADGSFSIGLEGGVPYIEAAWNVEPGTYTVTATATFVAIPDFGAETSIDKEITVTVKAGPTPEKKVSIWDANQTTYTKEGSLYFHFEYIKLNDFQLPNVDNLTWKEWLTNPEYEGRRPDGWQWAFYSLGQGRIYTDDSHTIQIIKTKENQDITLEEADYINGAFDNNEVINQIPEAYDRYVFIRW